MKLSTQLRELIDSNSFREAVQVLEASPENVTSSDTVVVYHLTQGCLNNQLPELAARVLLALTKSSARLMPYDFESCLSGLIRTNSLEIALKIALDYIDSHITKDPKEVLIVITEAIARKEPEKAFSLLLKIKDSGLPMTTYFWETCIKGFLRYDCLTYVSKCLMLSISSLINNESIWKQFYEKCIHSGNLELAVHTIKQLLSMAPENSIQRLWNVLLVCIARHTHSSGLDLVTVINEINTLHMGINPEGLDLVLKRLLEIGDMQRILSCLKRLKASVTAKILTNVVSGLIDYAQYGQALEVVELIVSEVFPSGVDIENLTLSNEKLKWIIKQLQLQIIDAKESQVEEEEDDEFILI